MNLEVLKHEDFGAIRVQQVAGQPWFVAKDVCQALGMKQNTTNALKALDDDEKGVVTIDTPGGGQVMSCINESGLYHLIFNSRKAQAMKFRKWVTAEVLPAIRKEGKYEAEAVKAAEPEIVPTLNGAAAAALMADIAFVEDKEMRERMARSMQVLMKSVKIEKVERL